MKLPTLAVFDFACCEGCQLQIINLEDELLNLVTLVEPVEWREALSNSKFNTEPYDIVLVEGSITRSSDYEKVRRIRQHSKKLIALGACATIGGVNRIKESIDQEKIKHIVYGNNANDPQLKVDTVKAVHEIVPVDYKIHGCPITTEELKYVITNLLHNTAPIMKNYPVCVECKFRDNICRYEYNELCLGVVTRAGCNAPCPSAGMWCFGCRGLVDNPNINAAHDTMAQYGLTIEMLKERLILFNYGVNHGDFTKKH